MRDHETLYNVPRGQSTIIPLNPKNIMKKLKEIQSEHTSMIKWFGDYIGEKIK